MKTSKLAKRLMSQNIVDPSSSFNLDEYADAEYTVVLKQALKTMHMIGSGATRAVFDYSDKYVLKVAVSKAGCDANKSECDNILKFASISPKVEKHASNYSWMLVQKCQPFDAVNVAKLIGVSKRAFRCVVDYAVRQSITGLQRAMLFDDVTASPKINIVKEKELVEKLRKTNRYIDDFLKDFNDCMLAATPSEAYLIAIDMPGRIKNFGLLDGKIKIIDLVTQADNYAKLRSKFAKFLAKLRETTKQSILESIRKRRYGVE